MKNLLFLSVAFLLLACARKGETNSESIADSFDPNLNVPAEGFDAEGSHPIAVLIADKVMTAMGGRAAWDQTRYLSWNFFGSRTLLWDKKEGVVRIENQRDDLKVIVDIDDKTGKVFKYGQEQTHPDSLSKYLEWGYRVWANDSYWLVMPFKMKDSGVTLGYYGEGETEAGEPCQIIRLSFYNVGVTPENSYLVWVSDETNLVKQWAFFRNFEDTEPGFIRPWDNYQQMGGILLSDDRGDRDLSDVRVLTEAPEGTFTSF